MHRRGFTVALLSAWAYPLYPAGLSTESVPQASEVPSHGPLTIDLQTHPNLQFRIDAFTVPEASRSEFKALMHRNIAFIETLAGFMSHTVFEKTSGPTNFNILTIAVWATQEAVAAAGEKVRAYYQSIGFDMPSTLARLGVAASLGYYHAPLAEQ
jgi:heme oxygenase (mycobilin-producing)